VWCETPCPSQREEQGLNMFDKGVLGKIYGHYRKGIEDEDNCLMSLVISIIILVDDLCEDDPGLGGNIKPRM
jgi:hypothetical protein